MSARLPTLASALPVLAALVLHAVAREALWTVLPAGALLLGSIVRGPPRYSPLRFVLVGAGFGLVGLALTLWSDRAAPLSILPPLVLAPLSAAAVGWSAFCAAARRWQHAWTFAALLAVFSVGVPWSGAVPWAFAAFLLSFLAPLWMASGARGGWAGWVPFAAFLAALLGLGGVLERTMLRNEGAVMGLLAELTRDSLLPQGFGFDGQLAIPRSGRVQVGDRVLFEVEGEVPERLRTSVLSQLVEDRWHALRGPVAPVEWSAETSAETSALTVTVLQRLGEAFPAPRWSRVEDPKARPQPGDLWTLAEARGRPVRVRTLRTPPRDPPPPPEEREVPEVLRDALRPYLTQLFPDPLAPAASRARQVEAFFRDGFEYSLDVDLSGRGHPLEVLIRERRAAYCTYFASAMAVLLRLEGIPARVVGGFVISEKNALTGVATVRERDAHAWVEVWLPEEGRYVAFDPTPWRSREEVLPPRVPGLFGSALDAGVAAVRRTFAAVRADPAGAAWGLVTWPWLWVALAGGVLWRYRARVPHLRRARRRGALEGKDARLTAWRGRYLQALARGAGIRAHPADTDEELLLRVVTERGAEARAAAERFVLRYQAARFQPGRQAVEVEPELAAALEDLEQALSRAAG